MGYTYTWSHFSKGVEDSVQNDKEREYTRDGVESASNDESKNRPEEETQCHGLLATNLVHEKTANKSSRKVKAVENSAIADVLDEGVVGVQSSDDGGTKDSERVSLLNRGYYIIILYFLMISSFTYNKIVEKPCQRCSEHGSPIALNH